MTQKISDALTEIDLRKEKDMKGNFFRNVKFEVSWFHQNTILNNH